MAIMKDFTDKNGNKYESAYWRIMDDGISGGKSGLCVKVEVLKTLTTMLSSNGVQVSLNGSPLYYHADGAIVDGKMERVSLLRKGGKLYDYDGYPVDSVTFERLKVISRSVKTLNIGNETYTELSGVNFCDEKVYVTGDGALHTIHVVDGEYINEQVFDDYKLIDGYIKDKESGIIDAFGMVRGVSVPTKHTIGLLTFHFKPDVNGSNYHKQAYDHLLNQEMFIGAIKG